MTRIDILRQLILDFDSGNQTAFAKRIGISPSQLNQWLTGHRRIGDAGARRIELALQLKPGHFGRGENVPHLAVGEPADDVMQQIITLVRDMSPQGRYVALGALQVLARQYPSAKANHLA